VRHGEPRLRPCPRDLLPGQVAQFGLGEWAVHGFSSGIMLAQTSRSVSSHHTGSAFVSMTSWLPLCRQGVQENFFPGGTVTSVRIEGDAAVKAGMKVEGL
jgi:hypothetical protein